MARVISLRGLDEAGRRIAGIAPSTFVQSMVWDNSTGAGAAFTSNTSAIGATTFIVNLITATTLANQTIRYESTLSTAELNGLNVGRISLHFGATAAVTSASTTFYAGVDQQTFQKTTEFALISRLEIQQRTT
jgi:2-methylisocitrate lyase-like PEP mutase family enzyme